jgi:hypothetical protein
MVNDRPRHNMSMSPEKPLELASSDTHNNGSHVDDPDPVLGAQHRLSPRWGVTHPEWCNENAVSGERSPAGVNGATFQENAPEASCRLVFRCDVSPIFSVPRSS